MRDQRLRVFRTAVDELVESLEAFIRLARWDDADVKPEPLLASAAKLHDRLGAADRLSDARFQGPPAETAKVDAMRAALKRLDAAYVAYCQATQHSKDKREAVSTLESEVAATAATSSTWS